MSSFGYDYALWRRGSSVPGTVSVAADSAVINGIGTTFLSSLNIGDVILVGAETLLQYRVIESVTSDTVAYSITGFDITGSGLSLWCYNKQLLGTVSIPCVPPKSVYGPYSKPLPLMDGSVRGGGWKTAEWRWGFLQQSERNALREFFPDASNTVVMRTKIYDSSDAYRTFIALGIWPLLEERDAGRRLSFVLKFQRMLNISTRP